MAETRASSTRLLRSKKPRRKRRSCSSPPSDGEKISSREAKAEAERRAAELTEGAHREAKELLEKASLDAAAIVAAAGQERARLVDELAKERVVFEERRTRLAGFLADALEEVEAVPAAGRGTRERPRPRRGSGRENVGKRRRLRDPDLVRGRMALTPVEIRNVDLPKARLRGYRRKDVEELIEEIADDYERVRRECARLSDRLQELELEATKHRELESVLRSALISAERAGQEMKEQARRESDLIVQEAHAESRRVTRESAAEKRRLEEDMTTIRAQLRAAFEMLGRDESARREDAPSATGPAAIGEALDSGIRVATGDSAPAEIRP